MRGILILLGVLAVLACGFIVGADQGPTEALKSGTQYLLTEYSLRAVAAVGPTLAFAVGGSSFGSGAVMRYDGTSLVPVFRCKEGWVLDIWAASANDDIYVMAEYAKVVYHFDGSSWSSWCWRDVVPEFWARDLALLAPRDIVIVGSRIPPGEGRGIGGAILHLRSSLLTWEAQ